MPACVSAGSPGADFAAAYGPPHFFYGNEASDGACHFARLITVWRMRGYG